MSMARRHDIRLAILEALTRRAGVPQTLDALAGMLLMEQAGISRTEILEELPGLIAHGYAVNHLAGRGWLVAATAAGMDQARRDAPLAEYVYGEAAFVGK